ncbi:MAG TPA: SDR family oxidoreductase [Polyangiaceae bacterium]|jgi:NAD(P)-dependent dehydrogenase (short-subunit alcohol dehydrogenase family)
MSGLDGKVVWVGGISRANDVGRAVALLLASRGASVLVTGTEERVVGACVGEIAHGGGRARHAVADAETPEGAALAIGAAVERFGALDIAVVVVASPTRSAPAWERAALSLRPGGRFVVIAPADATADAFPRVAASAAEAERRSATFNLLVTSAGAESEPAAECVRFLCSPAGRSVSGSVIVLKRHAD